MAQSITNLFWDSCVFYTFLRGERASYDVDSIAQYLQEARQGKHRIYASSIVLAEVVPSAIVAPSVGSFQDFIDDMQGAIVVVSPSPNVMLHAGRLRDLPYRKDKSKQRRLSTQDAIVLSSCINLYGLKMDVFHTFDDGKKRDPVDGKMVPLISYEDWCEGFSPAQMAVAKPVIDLNRRRPVHPSPLLPGT